MYLASADGAQSRCSSNSGVGFLPRACVDVIHIPFTYFPDPVGGTEVYVAGLVKELESLDIKCAIAAPGRRDEEYVHDAIHVFRFASATGDDLLRAYGAPDEIAVEALGRLLSRIRPRLVHLHARTASVSERVVDVARAADAKVILTYHTPSVSCVRGTLMRFGNVPCDGILNAGRCTDCLLQSHGVPLPVRKIVACTPGVVGWTLNFCGLSGGAFTALRVPSLTDENHRGFRALVEQVDHIVAVCDWVADLLQSNGVPKSKITLSRQGLVGDQTRISVARTTVLPSGSRDLRLGYFGRIDHTKGIDLVVEAILRRPELPVVLDIYGILQEGADAYLASLKRKAAGDARVAFRHALEPRRVVETMSACDMIVVPSRWLETGPLVVLEAFAAKTPVLGARLGGIAELVTDGVDGILVAPEDVDAWGVAISRLAQDRAVLTRLRSGVRPPRTMNEVARDMTSIYQRLVDREISCVG